MFNTAKMFAPLATPEWKAKSLEELCEIYQTENLDSKTKNIVFATVYTKLFPLMLKICKNFKDLTSEQKAETTCVKVDFCLKHFRMPSTAKFSTYFHTSLVGHLINDRKSSHSMKKEVWHNIVQPSELRNHKLVKTEFIEVPQEFAESHTYRSQDELELINCLKNSDLFTQQEADFCNCLYFGHTKYEDIANRIKVEKKHIGKLKKSVKEKLIKSGYKFF